MNINYQFKQKLAFVLNTLFCISIVSPAYPQISEKLKTLRWGKVYSEDNKTIVTAFKTYSNWNEKKEYGEFKVYRTSCLDFTFGTDYQEYFDGMDFKETDCIYQDSLETVLGVKFRFEDTAVEKGSVYAYWIATSKGKPLGPLPVKVRDPEVWWPYKKVLDIIAEMRDKYPQYVTTDTIGYSVNKRPLIGMRVGKGPVAIALIGAVHAGESGPELIIPILERMIREKSEELNEISLIAIPSLNCDNREKLVRGNPWYLRRNANGVDLNRNFPAEWTEIDSTYRYYTTDPDGLTYRGSFPGSESETIATMRFLKKFKPKAVFSFHCLASICGETLLVSNTAKNDNKYINLCNEYAKTFWQGIDPQLAENMTVSPGCSSGSLPAWCYQELGVPAYDIEAPVNIDDTRKAAKDKTDIILLTKYRERLYSGFVSLLNTFNNR